MAPRPQEKLLYENDDLELVDSFSKKGASKERFLGSLKDIFWLNLPNSLLLVGYRTQPILFVNGEKVPDDLAAQARSNQTLLSFLRDVMKLRGSKLGCSEGGCGACSVM